MILGQTFLVGGFLFSGFELFCSYYYGEGGLGLSVLRTFRLLRIIKLVRFLPNLQRSLVVMLRTMDNVAVFFGLLMLFIFIFRFSQKSGIEVTLYSQYPGHEPVRV